MRRTTPLLVGTFPSENIPIDRLRHSGPTWQSSRRYILRSFSTKGNAPPGFAPEARVGTAPLDPLRHLTNVKDRPTADAPLPDTKELCEQCWRRGHWGRRHRTEDCLDEFRDAQRTHEHGTLSVSAGMGVDDRGTVSRIGRGDEGTRRFGRPIPLTKIEDKALHRQASDLIGAALPEK